MSDEFGTTGSEGYLTSPLTAQGTRLGEQASFLRALLDSLDQGIAVLDECYGLLYCNRPLRDFFGLASASALEQKLLRLVAGGHRHWLRHGRPGDWEECFLATAGPVKARLSALPDELAELLAGDDGKAAWLLRLEDRADEAEWEQALGAARLQAEKSNRARTEFLSHMSHELRTPLNAIVGFTQLLETGANLDAEQHDNLREIKSASQHLLALINDILDVARLESGKTALAVQAFDSSEVVAECLALVRPLAQKNGVGVHRQGHGLRLATDRMRLKQVLLNLLSNAIKYNRPGGRVHLREFPLADGGLRVEVVDTGIGIKPEFEGTLFSPFERLGIAGDHIEGSGIGLMITRHLVTLLRGRINLASRPGTGSVFWFEIPTLGSPE